MPGPEGPHALAGGPADLRAGPHRLRQKGVERGVGAGGEPAFGVRAQAEAAVIAGGDACSVVTTSPNLIRAGYGLRVEPQDAFGVRVRHLCLIGRGEWRGADELGRLLG